MIADERMIHSKYRILGYLGPVGSCFTLAWLATHRDRLRSLIVGSKRLTVMLIWDTEGGRSVDHSDAEVDALATIVYGKDVQTPQG